MVWSGGGIRMSQQQTFNQDGTPGAPNINFISGNDAVAVGPNPATHVINVLGSTVVNGTNAIPVYVKNTAAFTDTVQVQVAKASASSDINNSGLSSFSSGDFSVDANGFVTLADKYAGTATTVGAVTADVITVPLGGVAGVFQFEARVKGFEATGPAAAGYNVYATFRTTGAAATLVGNQDIFNEDVSLAAADAYFVASGNNAVLQVLGVVGLTINWVAETELT